MSTRRAIAKFGGGPLRGRHRVSLWASVLAAAAVVVCLSATPATARAVSSTSIVAQARLARVDVFRFPGGQRPRLTIRNPTTDGVPVTFLVKQRRQGWEQVYLPMRPNGSTGWVRDESVTLLHDPYRVDVSLSAHALTVWKGDRIIDQEPAGVGRPATPTPTGNYFLVALFKQRDPSGLYGPYAFGTSAFSNALFSFGGGPGQIGLHGTNEPAALGTDVSHGCIRISNAGITMLAGILPLGTPITITR